MGAISVSWLNRETELIDLCIILNLRWGGWPENINEYALSVRCLHPACLVAYSSL